MNKIKCEAFEQWNESHTEEEAYIESEFKEIDDLFNDEDIADSDLYNDEFDEDDLYDYDDLFGKAYPINVDSYSLQTESMLY